MGDVKRIIAIILLIVILALIVIFIFDNSYFMNILKSLERFFIGYIIGTLFGLIVSILLALNNNLRLTFKPYISFFASIPTIAWVPIFLIFFGITEKTVIITISTSCFIVVIYNFLTGIESVKVNLINTAKILGYNRLGVILNLIIPASMNSIITGLKIGISYSWRALVGAEMLAVSGYGLGFAIYASRSTYNITKMVVSIIFIGLIGLVMQELINYYILNNTIKKWGQFD